ncbi:MAG: hypothetical protein AAFZ01_05835 [Pseudomonadota bacterium]
MTKNILYIDATPDNAIPKQIIECVAKSFDYDVDCYTVTSRPALEKYFESIAVRKIDILYIAAHGNTDGIALQSKNGANQGFIDWRDLATIICAAEGLQQTSTLFLACCDGGFKRAALILMARCLDINTVAGLPCKLALSNEGLAFHTFVNHLHRNSDAQRIARAVTTATDQQFNIFFRHEMDAEIAQFAYFCGDLWLTDKERISNEQQADNLEDAA